MRQSLEGIEDGTAEIDELATEAADDIEETGVDMAEDMATDDCGVKSQIQSAHAAEGFGLMHLVVSRIRVLKGQLTRHQDSCRRYLGSLCR